MTHYNYAIGQRVWLKSQQIALLIVALGTSHDRNVPVYFVRPPDGQGALWGMFEHEIERAE